MTEGESLLASVIADPADDTIRLVYADWLEENGGEAGSARAEFIRVQIEKESAAEGDPIRAALEAREKELLDLHAADWLRHLPEWARPLKWKLIATAPDDFGFRRGFLRGVVIPPVGWFLAGAPAVFAAEPITHVWLSDAQSLPLLRHSREFLGVIGLHFSNNSLRDEGAILFSEFPPMPRLRQLRMDRNMIGDRGLKALARWAGLIPVEELNLAFNDFKSPGLKALIASPYLTNLKRLDVGESRLVSKKTKEALRDRFGEVVQL